MQYLTRRSLKHANRIAVCFPSCHRTFATQANIKKEGDISSVFVSLSGAAPDALPERFANLKRRLLRSREDAIVASWNRLLKELAVENKMICERGSDIIPQINYEDLDRPSQEFKDVVRKRGVAVIRNVVPESEAREYKDGIEAYIKANPQTKGFPPNAPAVFELYWSPSQLRARSHPNLLNGQRYLMSLWHTSSPASEISTSHPMSYADRLRIRQPGDSGFALGPHIDGGSVERWEPDGYGVGGVYDKIFEGKWEEYDPWESSTRVPAISDLYNSAGGCSVFRMFQGWLSMSTTGPGEGTLLVNPLLKLATAYFLLRPFFEPIRKLRVGPLGSEERYMPEYVDVSNWRLQEQITSELQGAQLGSAQELNAISHPHIGLPFTMVHVPTIRPGDYVAWHCDTIHSVDALHQGRSDSSVMYIPVCPVTESNAEYLAKQRDAFLGGFPGPDLPGGKGESAHVDRPTVEALRSYGNAEALQAMGFARLNDSFTKSLGAERAVARANEILGFSQRVEG